jgi:hypothetical protein
MAGHQLKSASITNLDALPIVANTIGEGAPGMTRISNDFVTPVSADDTTSTYRLCRFPTTAKIKQVILTPNIATAGSGDIDIAFSDSTSDGTQPSLQGGVVQITGPVDNKLFGAAQSLVIANIRTDFTFKGTFTAAMQNLPIWQALVNLGATQFTADPGGFFDLFIKITTTITTSNGNLIGEVWYVE